MIYKLSTTHSSLWRLYRRYTLVVLQGTSTRQVPDKTIPYSLKRAVEPGAAELVTEGGLYEHV